ncbi:phenylacetate--CoA ligase family protein [Sulfuricystis multivorans]|uniref:phenylacetate--CoA ligase family protein n=1 Tax=Sulfuricystis multivorans TaxID=2211108 RepID=UPI000F81C779|nr:phenylacetate--CoA ligase family protein [Sulfuricystis multivorans]
MGTAALRVWLHRRQRPLRYRLLRELLATQALSREALAEKQRRDLAAIIAFARENTAYYAKRLRLCADWRIEALPILTKDDVRAHLPELLVRGHDPATTPIGHTGGSTGQPLAFYYDDFKHELMRAGMMRSYLLSGWRPGQKILNFWGARQDTVKGGVFGSAAWDDFIAAEKTLPAHEIDAAKLAFWADFICRYRPALLQGYASILALLARFVLDEKRSMPDCLIGVYSTAEMLSDEMRETIEAAFGCKVFNQYGSREIPNIACECRHGNMHIFTDMVWLESIDGQLIVTSLTNRLMPMIRYAIGDCGELLDGECSCGLPFPLLAMGVCRHNDLIRTPDGGRLHPSFFNRLLYGLTQIRQYQFEQDAPDRLRLHLAADEPLSAKTVAHLRAEIAAVGLALSIDYVPEIARTISGKQRFVIRAI